MDRITALRAFRRLVELESFTAAADELRVKQSTVSKWVAALEDELGTRLLDRTPRSLRVTDAGRAFFEKAGHVVDAWDEATADVGGADAMTGQIRMSVPVVFGQRFVIPHLTEFLRRHDALHVDLVFSDRYIRLVEEGFDLAIRVGLQVDSALRSHALGTSSRKLVASPGYVERHGAPSRPTELAGHECLLHSDAGGTALWRLTRNGETHRATVRGRITANNSEATLALARAGLGVALLADWLVDADLRSGRLVPLLEDYGLPPAPVRALTPPGRHVPPRVRNLIEFLRAQMNDAPAMPGGPYSVQ